MKKEPGTALSVSLAFSGSRPLHSASRWRRDVYKRQLKAWLDGVSTFDGKDGLAALQASLK